MHITQFLISTLIIIGLLIAFYIAAKKFLGIHKIHNPPLNK